MNSAIAAVIFDFDGTLVDSDHIKEAAYFAMFPEIARATIEKIRKEEEEKAKEGKGSRKTIIGAIIKALKAKGLLEYDERDEKDIITRYVAQYSTNVEQEITKAKAIAGATQCLEELGKKYPLHICSATPQPYLQRILRKRDMHHYFKNVYGSDTGTKEEIIGKILVENSLSGDNVAYVGNMEADREAAEKHGLFFIPVRSEKSDFKGKYPRETKDLSTIPEILSQ